MVVRISRQVVFVQVGSGDLAAKMAQLQELIMQDRWQNQWAMARELAEQHTSDAECEEASCASEVSPGAIEEKAPPRNVESRRAARARLNREGHNFAGQGDRGGPL